MNKTLDFVNRFNIINISRVEKTELIPVKFDSVYDYTKHNFEPIHNRQRQRNYVTCEIPENKFEEIVDITEEWFELMKDGECARLLMEARFINRLKRGK